MQNRNSLKLGQNYAYRNPKLLYKCQIIVAGFFLYTCRTVRRFSRYTPCRHNVQFGCVQHVPQTPTHVDGGTIDLVYTKSEQTIEDMLVDPPGAVSDHSLIHWRVPLQTQPPIVVQREVRRWKSIDTDAFRTALLTSDLCDAGNRPSTSDEYFDHYDRVLQALADEFAPVLRLGR